MGERGVPNGEFEDLPSHEYCANCNRLFDAAVLDPTVSIFETDEERVIHSFCDEECLDDWVADKQ